MRTWCSGVSSLCPACLLLCVCVVWVVCGEREPDEWSRWWFAIAASTGSTIRDDGLSSRDWFRFVPDYVDDVLSSDPIEPPPTLLPNIIFFHWMTCCACSGVSARVMCFLSILLLLFSKYYIYIFLTREIHYISTFLVSSISSGLFIIKALSFYFIRLIRKQQQIRRRQHQQTYYKYRHSGAPSLCKRQTP